MIKEGKQGMKMTRLSCHQFRSDQVWLALSLVTHNLSNLCGGRYCPSEPGIGCGQRATPAD